MLTGFLVVTFCIDCFLELLAVDTVESPEIEARGGMSLVAVEKVEEGVARPFLREGFDGGGLFLLLTRPW